MKGHLIALAPLLSGLISQSNSVYLPCWVYFKKSSWALRPGGPNKTYDVGDSRLAADASHLIGQMFRLKRSILLHGALTTPLAVHDSWQGCTLLCYLMRASNMHTQTQTHIHTQRETSLLHESVLFRTCEREEVILLLVLDHQVIKLYSCSSAL